MRRRAGRAGNGSGGEAAGVGVGGLGAIFSARPRNEFFPWPLATQEASGSRSRSRIGDVAGLRGPVAVDGEASGGTT
jgi:hypothetical protein